MTDQIPLTGDDLAALRRFRERVARVDCDRCSRLEHHLADEARLAAPGVDDATLATVLLRVARRAGSAVKGHRMDAMEVLGRIAAAAADLAALELEELS